MEVAEAKRKSKLADQEKWYKAGWDDALGEVEKHDFTLCFLRPDLCKKWGCKCRCHKEEK
jgi:hypothetical protein